jgi:hypothetical protein
MIDTTVAFVVTFATAVVALIAGYLIGRDGE